MATEAVRLETFKSFYPTLKHVQALTLDDVNKMTNGQPVDWNAVTPVDFASPSTLAITDCQMSVGYVIFDVICLAVGAVGLRSGVKPQTIKGVVEAATPSLPKIKTIIAQLNAENATVIDKAWGVYQVLEALYSTGALGLVFEAFIGSLTWWNMLIYGITGLASIIALFATDGLAFAAEVVLLLVSFGYLISDVVDAVDACGLTPSTPPTGPQPKPGEPYKPSVALRTINGHFVTVVNNGGLGGPNAEPYVFHTDQTQVGSWEKFTLVPLDAANQSFALKTMSGNYITANGGGGWGGPKDPEHSIHTDATKVGSWESLVLIQQADGTYAIATTSDYYLTAVNGGGMGSLQTIMRTNATEIGPWETFSFKSL